MGQDNVIGSIKGTATYEKVKIGSERDGYYHVEGIYGESKTIYQVPNGFLYIGGLEADPHTNSVLTLEPEDDDGWVWVEATEDDLRITKEEPDNE